MLAPAGAQRTPGERDYRRRPGPFEKPDNLTGLYLGETKVTDAGLVHLKRMTKMQYLRLHTVPLSDAGLQHLTGMTELEQLDLWETNVTDAGVAKLKEVLRNLKVARERR